MILTFLADHFIVNAPSCMGSWLNSAIPWHQIAPMVNKSRTANNTSNTDNQNEKKVKLEQVCLNCGITIDIN